MEALPCASPWELDQHTVPVPWRRSMASLKAKRLRIGFLVDDGVVRVQPPIARAVREVVDALKAAGHDGIIHLPFPVPCMNPLTKKVYSFRMGWLVTWVRV